MSIDIESDNEIDSGFASAGSIVTVTIVASEAITTPTLIVNSGLLVSWGQISGRCCLLR